LKRSRRTNVVEVHETIPSYHIDVAVTDEFSPGLQSPQSSPHQQLLKEASNYLFTATQTCEFRRVVNQHVQHVKSLSNLPGGLATAFHATPPLCHMLSEVKAYMLGGAQQRNRISSIAKTKALQSWFPSLISDPDSSHVDSWWSENHKQAWVFIKSEIRWDKAEEADNNWLQIFTRPCHCPHASSYPTVTFSCDFDRGGIQQVTQHGSKENKNQLVFDVQRSKIQRLDMHHLSNCDTFILWVAMKYHKHVSMRITIKNPTPPPLQDTQMVLHNRINNLRQDVTNMEQYNEKNKTVIQDLKEKLNDAATGKDEIVLTNAAQITSLTMQLDESTKNNKLLSQLLEQHKTSYHYDAVKALGKALKPSNS